MQLLYFSQEINFWNYWRKTCKSSYKEEAKKVGTVATIVLVIGGAFIGITVSTGLLTFDGVINVLTTAAFIIPILFLYKLFSNKKISAQDRKKLVPFLKLFCAQIVVATSTVMITSALAVFVEAKVDRHMLGIEFAPATFTSIYNVFGLILGTCICISLDEDKSRKGIYFQKV